MNKIAIELIAFAMGGLAMLVNPASAATVGIEPSSTISAGGSIDAVLRIELPPGGTAPYVQSGSFVKFFSSDGQSQTLTDGPLEWRATFTYQTPGTYDITYAFDINIDFTFVLCAGFICSIGPGTFQENGIGSVGSVLVTAETPLPAALPLFVSGLGILGFVGYRRKKAA